MVLTASCSFVIEDILVHFYFQSHDFQDVLRYTSFIFTRTVFHFFIRPASIQSFLLVSFCFLPLFFTCLGKSSNSTKSLQLFFFFSLCLCLNCAFLFIYICLKLVALTFGKLTACQKDHVLLQFFFFTSSVTFLLPYLILLDHCFSPVYV